MPLILISPYAKLGYISREQGSQASVVKFVTMCLDCLRLRHCPMNCWAAFLARPVGAAGSGSAGRNYSRCFGLAGRVQHFASDGNGRRIGAGLRHDGSEFVTKIPQTTGLGCYDLGILTVDRQLGIKNNIPSDFNPRPDTNPSPTQ